MDVIKNIARDSMNWGIGYVLSQPVDLDLIMIGYFALQFLGVPTVVKTIRRLHPS